MLLTANVSTAEVWAAPPDDLRLDADALHVWRARLDLPASRLDGLRASLSDDERARAERFYFQRDSDHFVAARGILREILGRYLNEAPERLRLCTNTHGKPSLCDEPGGLRFNVAHSHGLALFAVTRGREVGVDVERIRPELEFEQIAGRFFSPAEVATLLALPEPLRPEAFFACWTRKEAYVKARGGGLSIALDAFEVAFAPGEEPALLHAQGDEAGRWSLRRLEPAGRYAGALAAEGRDWRLTRFQW